MGLNTSHGCYDGGYCSFNEWRNILAKTAGYKLTESRDDGFQIPVPDIDYGSFSEQNIIGKWNIEPEDILIVLLAHHDDEGCIYQEHTGKLADRLEELLAKLWEQHSETNESDARSYLKKYIDITTQFIDGLRKASKRKQKVTFG